MHGHGGEQRRDHQQGEDAAEAQAQAEQGAAAEGADDRADAAQAKGPADPGGAAAGRIEIGGQGVGADLRAADAETDAGDAQRQQGEAVVEAGDAEDEQGAADVGQAQHPVRVEAIHGAAQEECAEGAAELEHGADRRRLAETEAGAADQRRQPVGQQVDDQQAHEKGGPEQQGAAAQLGAEDLPQGRGAVGLVGGQFEASGPAVGQAPQAFEDAPQARRVRCAAGEEAHRLRQACPEQRQARQGRPPPSSSTLSQPSAGTIRAASRPPSAEPRVKPQNIAVTISARCRRGQYSEVRVIALGIAPPRPRPVKKRSRARVSTEPA